MKERAAGLALLALVGAAVPAMTASALGGASLYTEVHRGFPGSGTALTAAFLRGAADLAAVLSLGAAVGVLVVHRRARREADRLRFGPDLTLLTWASAAWTILACANIVVSATDANGIEMSRLLEQGALGTLYTFGYMPRAWTVTAIGAAVLWLCAHRATRWTSLLPGLWAGCIGILAPVVVGQILVGPDHDIGSDAGATQTLAAGLLLGPVLVYSAAPAVLGQETDRLRTDARRLAVLGLIGTVVVLLTELVVMWFELAGSSPWASPTGLLGITRSGLLILLLVVLLLARRGLRIPRLVPGALVVLWIGAGAAMTRIPPPQYFVPTSISQVFMGFEVPDPPTVDSVLHAARLNLLFATLSVAGLAGYLAMVGVLRHRGLRWPVGRILMWCAGWIVVLAVTNTGVGRYSAPDFGMHMVVHMSLAMLAPILLVQGGVVTLILRAARADRAEAGVHVWVTQILRGKLLGRLYHPAVVFVVFIGSYYVLYFTPLFGEMMRFHWAHQLMNLHFLVTGYAYYSLIIGVDRPPRPLPHIGRLGYTLAAMPFHAFFGVAIITSQRILAQTYYEYLDLPWADLWHSQQVAGTVAWGGGEVPLLIAIIALCIQWSRQDDKEARRRDRHFDRGLDHEFDAYNDMLKKLSERKDAR